MDIKSKVVGLWQTVRGWLAGLSRRTRIICIIVACAVVAALIVVGAVYWFTPVTIDGMDASHYQGSISWKAVKNSGKVQFTYLKATEGSDYKDANFTTNWKNADATGLKVGAYHYFTTSSTGEAQAQNFIATVPKTKGRLAPAVDIEATVTTENDFKQQVADYVQLVEKHYGQKPVFYVPPKVFNLLYDTYSDYPFWVINVKTQPDVKGWTFWQYTNTATLPGVDGKIDLDRFQGSRLAFQKLLS